jgi:hypothetical protein
MTPILMIRGNMDMYAPMGKCHVKLKAETAVTHLQVRNYQKLGDVEQILP